MMMILKVLFWLAFAFDVCAIGLIFVLSLAAAPSSRTSPLTVVWVWAIVPGVILAALAFWFLRAQSLPVRIIPLLVVAAPLIAVAVGQIMTGAYILANPEEAKRPVQFHPTSLADLQSAVLDNNAEAVKKAALAAGLKDRHDAASLIILALHRLEKSPEQLPVFQTLLEAGADPNGTYGELPLEVAIRASKKTGPEPVSELLKHGAKPNTRNQLGEPAFFAATASAADIQILKLLIDHGADINTPSVSSGTALQHAAVERNWKAALLLLARGADTKPVRMPDGKDFRELVESSLKTNHADKDLAELHRILQAQ